MTTNTSRGKLRGPRNSSRDFEHDRPFKHFLEQLALSLRAPHFELRIPTRLDRTLDVPALNHAAAQVAYDVGVAAIQSIRQPKQRGTGADDPPGPWRERVVGLVLLARRRLAMI